MPTPPRAALLRFQTALRQLAIKFAKLIRLIDLRQFAGSEQIKNDASVDDALRGVRPAMLREIAKLKKPANDSATGTIQHSKREFERLGIEVKKEPELTGLVPKWREQNLERITSLFDDEIARLGRILEAGENKTVEQLADEIEWRLDVTRGKAETLARDQVYTLDAQVASHRQQAAGIEEYVWTTEDDERVRHSHAEMDGKVCRWDDPPIVDDEPVHPGEPINCRCRGFPVLPDADADEE